MPRIAHVVVVAVIAAACSGANADDAADSTVQRESSTTVASTQAPRTSVATEPTVPSRLSGLETTTVRIGDRELLSVVADTAEARRAGLMHVTDLGPLDGMLFVYPDAGERTFWMVDTVIPLDIAWFDQAGRYVHKTTMEPCGDRPSSECPRYPSLGGAMFAFEAPAGHLDFVDQDSVLTVELS